MRLEPNLNDLHTSQLHYKIYDRLGNQISSFHVPNVYFDPPVAHLSASRVAIAHLTTFGVWDMQNGELLNTAGPGHDSAADYPRSGLIAANNVCCRLVFCPTDSCTMHVYDAMSLELLSSFLPDAGCCYQSLAVEALEPQPEMIWWVYGWLVSYNLHTMHHDILQPQAGGTSYEVVALGQGRRLADLKASLCSPCGAYICIYSKRTAELQVKDTRSGKLMLRRTLRPSLLDQSESRSFLEADICWSRCWGRQLMLLICASSFKRPEYFCEQLYILHFC